MLLIAAFLHQAGAAFWIGGIPSFIAALAWVDDGYAFRVIGSRFSWMSMVGVACILVSGVVMSLFFISATGKAAFYDAPPTASWSSRRSRCFSCCLLWVG